MEPAPIATQPPEFKKRMGWGKFLLILVTVAAATSGLTYFFVTRYLFPKQLHPVKLSETEKAVLDAKLDRLDPLRQSFRTPPSDPSETSNKSSPPLPPPKPLEPERYSEAEANREITFSTREINALIASNEDLAQKLAIDFSNDMASAKLLIPLDPEFPIIGGKTLKVTAGLELRYSGIKPVVALKGVSIWGVPLPNAWLGGIKNVDLVSEFGLEKGFWNAFAAGVAHVQVTDGHITLKLRE